MENIKIRLPKCLSEEEKKGINEYNETILNNFAPNEREGMSKGIFVYQDDRGTFCPYPEYSPWVSVLSLSFEEDTTNKALNDALQEVLKQTAGGCEWGDLLLFFNRAYAIATHVLNNPDTIYTLKSYLKIWDNHYDTSVMSGCYGVRFSQQNSELCKHICASMVYCILVHEDENRPEELLQEIEWLLLSSQRGIDTLKMFKDAVAANEQTEENTQGEVHPQANTPPLEDKEEEATRTDATKDVFFKNTALLQFKEEGGIEKWASLVNEAIMNIEDRTLSSALNNTMLAVMYYFASGWLNRKGIFKIKPNVKQIVYFFLSRCDFHLQKLKGKTLVNKMNELLKGDKQIEETDVIEQVKKNIQKILAKNS